jgi:hypothetical protein
MKHNNDMGRFKVPLGHLSSVLMAVARGCGDM